MRRMSVVTAVAVLGAAVLTPPAGAAARETCGGRATTVAATSGDITGTEGPDVVVVDAAARYAHVALLGGDDLVCVTGTAPEDQVGVLVVAGPGDDVVDTTAAPRSDVDATLGAGADRFVGGPGPDTVSAGEYVDGEHVDTDRDVVLAGGGEDRVTSGSSGETVTDLVDLGAGPDVLLHDGTAAPGGSVTGGPGQYTLVPAVTGTSVTVDNAAGRFLEDGRVTAAWTSLEHFQVAAASEAPLEHVTFVGTDADERLIVLGSELRLSVRLGAGDDELATFEDLGAYRPAYGGLPAAGSAIDAGPGRDRLAVMADERGTLALDLRSGRLRVAGPGGRVVPTSRFDDAVVVGDRVELAGTGRSNRLTVSACVASADGRGGDDSLRARRGEAFGQRRGCAARTHHLSGGAGDDVLVGTDRADRLVGGPGRDTARGGRGRDRCTAEVRRRCEAR